MECLVSRPLPFGPLQEQDGRESLLPSCIPKRVCRPRFSFFANDQPVPYGAPALSVTLAGCGSGLVAQLVRARA